MAYSGSAARARRRRQGAGNLLALPVVLLAGVIVLAVGYVAYVLWPRWPGPTAAPQAPSLPITIGNVTFNIPPAAIRVKVQQRPGTQERVDLAYLWPSLVPPDPTAKLVPPQSPQDIDRVFLTISASDGSLAPAERVKTIYPRYLAEAANAGVEGLAIRAFRDGTPYQGEDLIYDPTASDLFLVRCTRQGANLTPGMCLYDRRIGAADIVLRFPREWLNNWRNVAQLIERLIASLKSQS